MIDINTYTTVSCLCIVCICICIYDIYVTVTMAAYIYSLECMMTVCILLHMIYMSVTDICVRVHDIYMIRYKPILRICISIRMPYSEYVTASISHADRLSHTDVYSPNHWWWCTRQWCMYIMDDYDGIVYHRMSHYICLYIIYMYSMYMYMMIHEYRSVYYIIYVYSSYCMYIDYDIWLIITRRRSDTIYRHLYRSDIYVYIIMMYIYVFISIYIYFSHTSICRIF